MPSTKASDVIKWVGSVTTAAGVVLTAFDITPANKIVGVLGSVIWCWAGWRMCEPSLWLLNLFFVAAYALGFVYSR